VGLGEDVACGAGEGGVGAVPERGGEVGGGGVGFGGEGCVDFCVGGGALCRGEVVADKYEVVVGGGVGVGG